MSTTLLLSSFITAVLLFNNCKLFLQPQPKKTLGTLWLNTSMYTIDYCYKENLQLLSLIMPFHIEENTIFKKKSNCQAKQIEIIKAGTKIEILELKYNNDSNNNSYILVKVAKERGNVNFLKNSNYIFLIPKNINTKEQIKNYLNSYFTTNDPNKWLILQQEHIQKAIFNKNPIFGMNQIQLKAALGLPLNIEKKPKTSLQEEQEIWNYQEYLIFFEQDQIIKISKI